MTIEKLNEYVKHAKELEKVLNILTILNDDDKTNKMTHVAIENALGGLRLPLDGNLLDLIKDYYEHKKIIILINIDKL